MKASFAELKASVEAQSAPTKWVRMKAASAPKRKATGRRKRQTSASASPVTETQSETTAEQLPDTEEVLEKAGG